MYPLPNKDLRFIPDLEKSQFHNLTITGPKTVFIILDLTKTHEK